MKTTIIFIAAIVLAGCDGASTPVKSNSGVGAAAVKVKVGSDGLTVEQRNVGQRLDMDNKPGSIKHLYVLSAYSGQVLIYSTVRGKVTSSGKRLTPNTVTNGYDDNVHGSYGMYVSIDNQGYYTSEVLQDDGTYGSSAEYIYWWDSKGVYHQQYITGGMILHISDQPLSVRSVILNMELSKPE